MSTDYRIHLLRGWDGNFFWRALGDPTQAEEYRRLAFGLAWSRAQQTGARGAVIDPGWIVLLGEERHQRADGRYHVAVLYEWEAIDLVTRSALTAQEVMAEAVALETLWRCSTVVSPLDQPDCALVPLFNRGRSRDDPRLVLRTPPRWGCGEVFLLYDAVLERRTAREKTLHFGAAGEKTARAYGSLQATDRVRPIQDYPAAAALLYALAWLEMTSWDAPLQELGAATAGMPAGY